MSDRCAGLFHTFRGPILTGDRCLCGETTYEWGQEQLVNATVPGAAGDGTNDPAYEALLAVARAAQAHVESPSISTLAALLDALVAAGIEDRAALASPEART